MEMDNCARAIEGFQKTLELKPDYMEAHKHLAICYKTLGNENEAQHHLALWNRAANRR